jgi:hypothetical protein
VKQNRKANHKKSAAQKDQPAIPSHCASPTEPYLRAAINNAQYNTFFATG